MSNSKFVVHISHVDLDGYSCSYLYADTMVKAIEEGMEDPFDLIQLNVNYPELTDCLFNVLTGDLPDIDHLIISDLNLKDDDVQLLETHSQDIKRLTLLDHHHNNEERLEALFAHRKEELGRGDDTLVLTKGLSATHHMTAWLESCGLPIDESAHEFTRYVNAWDVHDFTSMVDFRKGQLINDVMTDPLRLSQSGLNDNGVLSVMASCLSGVRLALDDASNAEVGSYAALAFEEALKRNIINALSSFTCKQDTIDHTETQKTLSHLGWTQSLSYLVARLYSVSTNIANRLIVGEGTRVFISQSPMPMALVHHLLYSVNEFDVMAILHPGKKIEFRQNSLNETVNLARVAKRFGGGGHLNAAGCPWPDRIPVGLDEVSDYMQQDGSLGVSAVSELLHQALEQEASY